MTTPRPMPALLMNGFRPFFLAAALWAAVALGIWMAALTVGAAPPTRFDPLAWHIHAMLFGFVLAAAAGFLLTAIPNWTGRLPVRGPMLALLAGLWLAGRIACLISARLPMGVAAAIDVAFPLVLMAVMGREIVLGRNWRNLPMVAPMALFALADLLSHLQAEGFSIPAGLGWRLGLAAAIILISVVGGRIIPSFTTNWLSRRKAARLPVPFNAFDRLALAVLHSGLIAWALFPTSRIAGLLLVAAGLIHLVRLARWRGWTTLAEPLLTVLHLGYGWLAAGAALLGLSVLGAGIPLPAAIHALTAGAIGTMILAVMTRATRGHSGRDLVADPATRLIYVAVTGAALARVAAAFLGGMTVLDLAAGLWIAAYLLFVVWYGPMLWRSRRPPSAPLSIRQP